MNLDQDQEAAKDMILSAKSPVRLLGGPGVGKSTTLNACGNLVKIAPNNKAAAVIGGTTIHKLLGLTVKRSKGKMITIPTRKTPRSPLPYKVALDEASCLSRTLMDKYVLPLIPNIVFVGDQAQLNPVGETTIPFMDLDIPTQELNYVHRFGGELLEVSYKMRKCVFDSSLNFEVPLSWGLDEDEMIANMGEDDVVIAWRNETVKFFNRKIRLARYGSTDWRVGERVRVGTFYSPQTLATESEHYITSVEPSRVRGLDAWKLGLSTGCTVTVVHDNDAEELKAEMDFLAADQNWRAFYGLQDTFCDLRPAYAITAHKSQGSTYANAFVDFTDIFENQNSNEAVRAAYVAATRAQYKCRNVLLGD